MTRCTFQQFCSQKGCKKAISETEYQAAINQGQLVVLFVAPPIECMDKGYIKVQGV